MKKIYLLASLLLCTIASYAGITFTVDGITYCADSSNASSCYVTTGTYSGDIVIPETVTYNSNEFTVTAILSYAFKNCSELTGVSMPSTITSIPWACFQDCSNLTKINLPSSLITIENYAFRGCNLSEVTLPNSITSIGDGAFRGCKKLTEVVFPSSLTTIGDEAFYWCSNLEKVVFPNSLTYIGHSAFNGCNLQNINLKNTSITTLNSGTFAWCENLFSVELPNTLTTIGEECFRACYRLENVKLPNSITTINTLAFGYCERLKIITIPNGQIGASAFQGCSSLEKVVLEPGVTDIGVSSFSSCPNLIEIEIPSSLKTISDYAFDHCKKLGGFLRLPASLKAIGSTAFRGTKYTVCELLGEEVPEYIGSSCLASISTIIVPASAASAYRESTWGEIYDIVSNSGKEVSVNVTTPGNLSKDIVTQTRTAPANVNKLIITGGTLNEDDFAQMRTNMTACFDIDMRAADCEVIPENAFNGRLTLKSIILPENTKEIKTGAFKDCTILSSVTLPKGLTIIGDEAFRNCDLSNLVFEGNLESIGNYAYTDNYKLECFNFGNALTSIGNNAFENCYSLSSAIFADGPLTIGNNVFQYCDALSSVKFAEGLTSIGSYAFYGCSKLEAVNIPSTTTSLGAYSFSRSNLTAIDLSLAQNLTLGYETFSEDYNLSQIIFPKALTTIPQGLLKKCDSLSIVDLSQTNVIEIKISAFENCSSLTSIKLPENGKLAKLDIYSIKGCSSLTEIDLSNTELTTLDTDVLRNCTALKTVKLPSTLQTIKDYVFAGDKALRTIVTPCTTPPTATSSSFTNVVTEECTLILPSTAFYDYLLAEYWGAFCDFDAKSDLTIENPEGIKVSYSVVTDTEEGEQSASAVKRFVSQAKSDDKIELMKDAMLFLPNEQTIEVKFECTDGLNITKVLLDNNDVTDKLVDNVLTIEKFTGSSTIKVESSAVSGINNVSIDGGNTSITSHDVYNLQGIRVKANATTEDIRNLSPGIYIFGGKKIIVK